jgi:hypothetical protein
MLGIGLLCGKPGDQIFIEMSGRRNNYEVVDTDMEGVAVWHFSGIFSDNVTNSVFHRFAF